MITANQEKEVFINSFEYNYVNKFYERNKESKNPKNPITLICDLVYTEGLYEIIFYGNYPNYIRASAILTNAYIKGAEDTNLIDILDESLIADIENKALIYQQGY